MIYIIVVVYNMPISDCKFFKDFEEIDDLDLINGKYVIVVYDNSPESQEVPAHLSSTVRYFHDSTNGGVANAYNYGLSLSTTEEDWLLLVDQDSQIPSSFFCCVADLIKQIGANDSIAAIAPHVV